MRWLAVVLAIFVVSAIVVNGQEKSSKTAPSQHPAEDVHKPEAPAPAIVPIKQEESGVQNNSAKDHAKNYLSRLFSPENLPNILLFFAGVGGIGVAVSTLKAIRRQADIMERQITQAAEGGKQTDQIIETMRDTAVRELRAYVCLSKAVIRFTQERAPEIHIYLQNFGKTPAYDVKAWIHTWIAQHPLNEVLPPPPPGFEMGADIFAPGQQPHIFSIRQKPLIPEHLMPLLGTPRFTLYVYGGITYRDVFGVERHTHYRLMHGGQEGVRLKDDKGIAVALLKGDREGNEAD